MNCETWQDDKFDIFVINYIKQPPSHNFKFTYGIILTYRQHGYNEEEYFKRLTSITKKVREQCQYQLVAGDLNTTQNDTNCKKFYDQFNFTSHVNVGHKHRPNTKEHIIDHIMSNMPTDHISINILQSFENISLIDKTLGHPGFQISIGYKQCQLTKMVTIKKVKWDKFLGLMNTSEPQPINKNNLSEISQTKIDNITPKNSTCNRFAESIVNWVNGNLEKATIVSKHCQKRIFNAKNLIQPDENPNPNNSAVWNNFYKAVNSLKSLNCRFNKVDVTPVEFRDMLQKKLNKMPLVDHAKACRFIDSITPKTKMNFIGYILM